MQFNVDMYSYIYIEKYYNVIRNVSSCGLCTLFGVHVLRVVPRVRPRSEVLIAVGDQRGERVNSMRRLDHRHLI